MLQWVNAVETLGTLSRQGNVAVVLANVVWALPQGNVYVGHAINDAAGAKLASAGTLTSCLCARTERACCSANASLRSKPARHGMSPPNAVGTAKGWSVTEILQAAAVLLRVVLFMPTSRELLEAIKLVFSLSASTMEQDYAGLLDAMLGKSAGRAPSNVDEEVRGRVHELLQSPAWSQACVYNNRGIWRNRSSPKISKNIL
jgi:hypothetical protein